MKSTFCFLWVFLFYMNKYQVKGNGRMLEPPSRSSLWRFKDKDPILYPYRERIQANYDDMNLNCGGREALLKSNGKCGVCGDPISTTPRDNEAGGKFGLGIISRFYSVGQAIPVKIEVTAARRGYFEFRLCKWNNVNKPITHQCLKRHLLIINTRSTRWYLPRIPTHANKIHAMDVMLPAEVICTHCVLQWRYRAGNSWGTENGHEGIGYGQQEEFYGCADIAIKNNPDESDFSSSDEETFNLSTSAETMPPPSPTNKTETSPQTNLFSGSGPDLGSELFVGVGSGSEIETLIDQFYQDVEGSSVESESSNVDFDSTNNSTLPPAAHFSNITLLMKEETSFGEVGVSLKQESSSTPKSNSKSDLHANNLTVIAALLCIKMLGVLLH